MKAWKRAGFVTANWLSSGRFAREIGHVLKQRYVAILTRQFSSQGAAGASGRWAPLTVKYAIQKSKRFPSAKILVATGRMKGSFLKSPSSQARVTGKGVEYSYGSTDSKADFHQFGTPRMPARRIIDFKEQHFRGIGLSIGRTMQDGMFTRLFFDTDNNRTKKLQVKYTGFEQKTIR